ncbi:GNAT family N-acetyltransferase [Archangium violaceum]|uniref:GNAT family N-acetyltransferase n=1 Tax=Archangium violaceum TaxID=83451 RepID=UPI00193BB001|nr:GNAT family protein [Archangium violaceum]QRK11568.1 GNAT family N-acetyltransferase [Archangium violaceum]
MTIPDIRLVPALPEHVDVWKAMREEPVSRRMMPLEPATRESLLKRILESTSDLSDPKATSFRWMVELEGRIIGTVAARELSRFHGRVEIGYMLSSAYHGRGIGTRAVTWVLERLFEWPFLHRVWLTTAADNLASQGLARKLGFTLEGVMREHYLIEGQRKDQQVWGLLRSQWEARARLSAGVADAP